MVDAFKFNSLAAALAVSAVAAAVKQLENYRGKAQECEERANRTTDHWAKQQFEECAKQWLRLAQQAERRVWTESPPELDPLAGSRGAEVVTVDFLKPELVRE